MIGEQAPGNAEQPGQILFAGIKRFNASDHADEEVLGDVLGECYVACHLPQETEDRQVMAQE
jgi:hypothetical protein